MRSWLVLFSVAFVLSACRTDEPIGPLGPTATLRIAVLPQWEQQPMQRFTVYHAPHGYRFQVEDLKLYLSEWRLVGTNGETSIDGVRLIDLGNGPLELEFKVPAGQWLGLRAGLGLPHAINYSSPSLYANEHPLSVSTGMWWSTDGGYKFVLFDGRSDADVSNTGPLLVPFSIHTGLDTCYRDLDLFPALPFSTSPGMRTDLTMHVAVDGFLRSPQDTIDVISENLAHMGNVPLLLKLTRNVKRSFRIEEP